MFKRSILALALTACAGTQPIEVADGTDEPTDTHVPAAELCDRYCKCDLIEQVPYMTAELMRRWNENRCDQRDTLFVEQTDQLDGGQ